MSTSDALNPNFALPDMGDYYYDAPDQQMFYALVDQVVNPLHRANASETAVAKFYQETPPVLGAVNETYTFSVSLGGGGIQSETEKVRGITVEDGDTIAIPLSAISAGDATSQAYLNRITAGAKETADAVGASCSNTKLKIRFAGLDCKELPHFTKAEIDEVTKNEKNCKIDDIKGDGTYLWSQYKSFMDDPITIKNPGGNLAQGTFFDYAHKAESANFVQMVDGCWHQYFGMGNDMYVLRKCDSNDYSEEMIADAGIARDVVVNAIAQATEMRIQIDGAKLSKNGNQIVTKFRTQKNDNSIENEGRKFLDAFFDNYTEFTTSGFNYWGLDSYGRAIGVVYVNLGGKWVNLNKMVIADTDWTIVNKYAGSGDGAIDTSGYDFDAKLYADSIYAQSKRFDDRDEVQGKIFGALGKGGSIKAMSDWTVTIGDVTLFVPPTSIRCLTQSKSQHMPVLRAKGTMAKSATKVQRIIEMDIYFNEDRGINGYKLETNTRADGKGQNVTYYMNGLRALYAEFRVAPFLPIDNKYVNEVLGVDAVSMLSFSCDTVPNFPKLIKATLQMSEFEYRIYMPEIPWDGGDDDRMADTGIRNYFSEQINYPLLRYYYQRLLMHGNELSGVKFLDDKYITSTFGNRTCLVPMQFKDPYIHFYIPNKENLDKLKAAKIARHTAQGNSADSTKLDKKDQQFANDLSKLENEVEYIQSGGDNAQSTMTDLNDYLRGVGGDFIIESDKAGIVVLEKTSTGYAATDKAKEIESHVRDYLSQIYHEYADNMGSVVNSEGNPLFTPTGPTFEMTDGDGDTKKLTYGIGGNVDVRYMSEDEMKKLKTLSTSMGGSFSADEVMQDRKITIPISLTMAKIGGLGAGIYGAQLGQEGADYFKLDDSKDLGFLKAAAKIAEKSGAPDDLSEVNKNINFVTKDTIKFEPYNDTEAFLVEGIHINTSNTFSQITLQETNGFAPQYMGGTDINISISMYTKSKQAAASMNLLPSISAEYARNYRLVLTAWPLRIESEFTKMFGITDVMVEAVEVDTVPNFPGLYHVTLSLVSVDRTLRNREAMQKKDMKNFHNLSVEGVAAERTWNYDQMNKYLSEAELYPDLELPTIAELADAGFSFIRYSNESRVYPDPDFYFTYSYVLMSQLIREAVLNGLNSTASEITMLDSMGNRMQGNLNTGMGAWEKNYEPDTTDEIQNLFRDPEEKIAARTICDFSDASKKNREEVWTIAPNIKVAFTEQRILNHLNDKKKQDYQASKGQTPVPVANPTNPNETANMPTSGGGDEGTDDQAQAQDIGQAAGAMAAS